MFLQLPASERASLEFGITIRAWSLVFAADAFISTKDALEAMDLIVLRCRQGTLRVQPTHPPTHQEQISDDSKTSSDPFKVGIAGIPLELLLSLRETIIDSALWDAKQKNIERVEAAHKEYNDHEPGVHRHVPFTKCLNHANAGELQKICDACANSAGPQIGYEAIGRLLAKYSLALVSSSKTPLLSSPPYCSIEPQPWVVALATHQTTQPVSRSSSFIPVHNPGPARPTTEISFFAPSFMRVTSSDIMRFRNLVRTWRLAVVDLIGPVATRGSESAPRSRCSSGPGLPGAMVDMEAMDLVQSRPTMGYCEPKWMLLNPNRHAG